MNEKQINLLKENWYEVLPEFGFIHKPPDNIPVAFVTYNNKFNQFGLHIIDYTVIGNTSLVQYSDILAKKDLVRQLN